MPDPNHIESPPAGANADETATSEGTKRKGVPVRPSAQIPRRQTVGSVQASAARVRQVRWIIGSAIAVVVVGGILLLVLNHLRTVRAAQDHAAFLVRQREERVAEHRSKIEEINKAIAAGAQSIAELEQRLALPTVDYVVTGLWGNAKHFAIYTAQSPTGENGILFVPSSLVVFPKIPAGKDPMDPNRLRYGSSGEMIPPDGPGTFTSLEPLPAIDWNVNEIKPPKSSFVIPEKFIGPRGSVVDDVDFSYRLHVAKIPSWIADRWQSPVALNEELAVARGKLVELKGQLAEEQAKAESITK